MVDKSLLMRCGFCGYEDERAKFGYYARPEPLSDYAEVIKCPHCKRWQAPLDIRVSWGYTISNS